jgi:phosphoribosyl-ATP pyrophosphohydrolase
MPRGQHQNYTVALLHRTAADFVKGKLQTHNNDAHKELIEESADLLYTLERTR